MTSETSLTKPGTNLVLGVIENYNFAQLEPFLLSLRRTGYKGEVAFFCHGVDGRSMDALRKFGVKLIPFRNVRGATRGLARWALDRLSLWFHRAKWPAYENNSHRLLSSARLRYRLYHRFLWEEGRRYDRVLLSDTRDVFFQADPFQGAPTEELLFFEESHPLTYGKINSTWIRTQFGRATLERLGSRMTLCSGTTIGTPAALCCYLERVIQAMRRASFQHMERGDQGVHNVVVYERLQDIPYTVRLCPNSEDQVYTLTQYLSTHEIALSAAGEVVDATGRVLPIVHQYDRHPEIMEAFSRKIHADAG